MILKSFEIEKINISKNNYYLFYGENSGYKKEIIEKKFKSEFNKNTFNYDENEILKDENKFFDQILTKSFFEKQKLILIFRTTDKLLKIIKEIIEREIDDVVFIFISEKLEKKSKIRSFFEKEKNLVCVPFYLDTYQSLSYLINNFFKKLKISVSQEITNIIIERSNYDRLNLRNELNKIQCYAKDKQKITLENIIKLTNLTENNNISELVDFCLAKKERKTLRIINENNFSSDDSILIIRTFQNKVKRLINLKEEINKNNNIENVISAFKPPIFWKDKEIVKLQIKIWSYGRIQKLLNTINDAELSIKKNYENSIKILLNFIFATCKTDQ